MDLIIKKKGFTLVELLLVVSIIAMLSSVVLSSLGEAKIKAADAAKVSATHEVRNALALYSTDNGGFPPTLADLVSSGKYIKSVQSYVDYRALQADGITVCTSAPCKSYELEVTLNNGSVYNGVTGGTSSGAPSNNPPDQILGNLGAECNSTSDCAEGLICDTYGYLCSDMSYGSYCGNDGECESSFCDSSIGQCTDGCSSAESCDGRGGYCSWLSKSCTNGGNGADCDSWYPADSQCQPGLSCIDDTCTLL